MNTRGITEERLVELKEAELKLESLESLGVNNWEGYSDAMSAYHEAHRARRKKETLEEMFFELEEMFGSTAYEISGPGGGVAFLDSLFDDFMVFMNKYYGDE